MSVVESANSSSNSKKRRLSDQKSANSLNTSTSSSAANTSTESNSENNSISQKQNSILKYTVANHKSPNCNENIQLNKKHKVDNSMDTESKI